MQSNDESGGNGPGWWQSTFAERTCEALLLTITGQVMVPVSPADFVYRRPDLNSQINDLTLIVLHGYWCRADRVRVCSARSACLFAGS